MAFSPTTAAPTKVTPVAAADAPARWPAPPDAGLVVACFASPSTTFSAGLLGVVMAGFTGAGLFAAVPFLGSGSSNSSADKHPSLSRKPERPDLFFFLGAVLEAGRGVDVVCLEDDAAAVGVEVFSVVVFVIGLSAGLTNSPGSSAYGLGIEHTGGQLTFWRFDLGIRILRGLGGDR